MGIDLRFENIDYMVKDMLPGKDPEIMFDRFMMDSKESIIINYLVPEIPDFLDKINSILIRHGWKLNEGRLDITPDRIYISFSRDQFVHPEVQAERLVKLVQEQTGKRDIKF